MGLSRYLPDFLSTALFLSDTRPLTLNKVYFIWLVKDSTKQVQTGCTYLNHYDSFLIGHGYENDVAILSMKLMAFATPSSDWTCALIACAAAMIDWSVVTSSMPADRLSAVSFGEPSIPRYLPIPRACTSDP